METDKNKNFSALYKQGVSEREKRLGDLARVYNVPKYAGVFFEYIRGPEGLDVLELGAGKGEVTAAILDMNPGTIKSYTATEITESGAAELRKLGVRAEKMDAEKILFGDNSFDVACCFDVMHHVSDPERMAREMTRVARKFVLLVEANGLCLLRKLMELTPGYRSFNENSYTPETYKSFFELDKFEEFIIKPFLFTPPAPKELHKAVMFLSEALERMPVLKFQCSSVAIFGRKKQT
jgi:ubiquinone/menaquinone biosynthesis C-methylase UbiE